MKHQFLHEHHNRQDKRFKADYREEMAERGRSDRTWTGTSTGGNSRQPPAAEVLKLRQHTIDKACNWHFVYETRVIKLNWKLPEFAKFNSLDSSSPATDQEFKALQLTVRADWKVIEQEIRRSKVRKQRARFGSISIDLGWFVDWCLPESVKVLSMQRKAPRLQSHSADSSLVGSPARILEPRLPKKAPPPSPDPCVRGDPRP